MRTSSAARSAAGKDPQQSLGSFLFVLRLTAAVWQWRRYEMAGQPALSVRRQLRERERDRND